MAEIVSSAVAQEAVNQVLSTIKERYKGKSETKEHMERMEMAHIKLEAALEMSDKWNTTSTSLLHWRSKLKRAAKECDDTLRSCKQRLQENEEMEQGVRSSFFPKRILCRARSLVSSIINHGNEEPSGSTVRRYEWLAEGATLQSTRVTHVYLQGHVAMSDECNRQGAVIDGKTFPIRGLPFQKISGIFLPHASSDDLSPTVGGSAIEMTKWEATQCCLYANISFEQLGRIILSKAVDCLRGNAATTSYNMLWKSKHGGSYIRIEESSWRATDRKGRKRQKWQGKNGNKVHEWTSEVVEFLGSLVVHAPAQLQGSIADWVQKQKQMLHIRRQLSPTYFIDDYSRSLPNVDGSGVVHCLVKAVQYVLSFCKGVSSASPVSVSNH
ncbi:hypothetical protein EJB05_54195, partial [Eragrostis curvula]